jgi:hypothetical protein
MNKIPSRTLRPLLVSVVAAVSLALPAAVSAQSNLDSVAYGAKAAVSAAPALSTDAFPSASLKPCASRYVHASLSWGHKCLAAGQFCKVGNREYLRYGFYCPASGHLRRR